MDLEEVRRFALSFPEATEEPHFEMTSFRVGRKIFATAPPDGDHLHIFVDENESRAVVSENPSVCTELWWGKKLAGVRIDLSAAEEDLVFELLEESWRRKASKRLIAQYEAGRD